MTDLRKAAEMALEALMDANKFEYKDEIAALLQALAQPEPFKPDWVSYRQGVADGAAQPEQAPIVTEKNGSPCPEFWDWLPKAYNYEGNGTFTKYNMEVAFLAGKNMALAQPDPVAVWELTEGGWDTIADADWMETLPIGTKLYTTPHSAKGSADSAEGFGKREYIDISVDGKSYRAHRLAWLYVNGNFPVGVIDHIDGNRANNRINNLRDVHNSVNLLAHRKLNSNNTSGFTGVHKNTKGWRAEITVRGKLICLGTYETPKEASIAYIAAKFLIEKMPWQGLTDEEIDSIFVDYGWCISTLYLRVVRSIEAKLKEKNT